MLWSEITAMEPLLPQRWEALEEQAVGVIRGAAALGAGLHPITRRSVAALLRNMNSYYSNLIEGHHTHPVDIERALKNDYVDDPRRRALQHLNAAHVQTEQAVQRRLADEPQLEVTDPAFVRWIHEQLYSRIPEQLCWAVGRQGQRAPVVGGALREREVEVGRHLAPTWKALPEFLTRFSQVYPPARFGIVRQVVVAAAAHHRLAWIHPFLDGNGRVARLFTQAYLSRARSDSGGLWSMARGMARRRERYMEALAAADAPRQGDLDGRGNLSLRGLESFCSFFLVTARDQIDFIAELLDLDGLLQRIATFVGHVGPGLGLRAEVKHLLRDVLLRGEVPRGEAGRVLGARERTARSTVSLLVKRGLLYSETPKAPLRLGLPATVVGYYFPRLYPEGVEIELMERAHQP